MEGKSRKWAFQGAGQTNAIPIIITIISIIVFFSTTTTSSIGNIDNNNKDDEQDDDDHPHDRRRRRSSRKRKSLEPFQNHRHGRRLFKKQIALARVVPGQFGQTFRAWR